MRTWVLAVLVATFVLVVLVDDSEGWVRRMLRGVRIRIRIRAKRKMGKRGADNPPCTPDDGMDQARAQKLLQKLSLECPNLGVNGGKLSRGSVMTALNKVDGDNDNALDQVELDELENVMDAYEACGVETTGAVADAVKG